MEHLVVQGLIGMRRITPAWLHRALPPEPESKAPLMCSSLKTLPALAPIFLQTLL
jgi:hypothetical protein